LHVREVARWTGYTWIEFSELDDDEQAAAIAHYEIIHKLESIQHYEQEKRARRSKT